VPSKVLAELHINYRANTHYAATKARELAELVSLFAANEIPVLAFKGPVLALMAYGDIAMRQYIDKSIDLDLLVKKRDVPRAAELLISAVYRPRTYDREAFAADFFQNTSDEFLPRGSRSVVDLHWKPLAWYFSFGPDEEDLWSRSESIRFEGQAVRTLAPLDLLHLLCVHASKHGWPTLASVAEIAALLRAKPQIDLAALCENAVSSHAERMIRLGLYLAYRLAGTCLPEDMFGCVINDPKVVALGERIIARMFRRLEPPGEGSLSSWRIALATIERPRDRVHYFVNLSLPTGGDWNALPLRRRLYPLYYLLRPFRIVMQIKSAKLQSAGSRLWKGKRSKDAPA
jgi:hypothetical protein